jgi:hypothetical protein
MKLRASARLICTVLKNSRPIEKRTPSEVGIVFLVILIKECKALLVFIYFCLEGLVMRPPKNSRRHFERTPLKSVTQTNAGDLSGTLTLEIYQAD